MLQVATDILKQMGISYNAGLEKELAPTYNKLQKIIPPLEWPHLAPYIKAINELKQEKNAVILAHNYQTADIFHTIADVKGDSLQLAKEASKTTADIIVQCGVYFMAETSKLLNPQKKVLIPDEKAGCSLADSITAQDVRDLRQAYPHTPIIAYVNSSCEVKAEADICCTSSNALDIVNGLGAKQVICIPDEYLAKNIAQLTNINVISYKGRCEVHERFTAKELQILRQKEDNLKIIAHPECAPDVIKEADFSGSTQAMIKWVETEQPKKILMVTECSMSDNVSVENPHIEFIRPCNLCPHMKRITLPKILESLMFEQYEISIEKEIAKRARQAVQKMIDFQPQP